jgi:hypothetical protein
MNSFTLAKKEFALPAPIVIALAMLRRFRRRAVRGASIVIAGYADGMALYRQAGRKHPFMGE